MEFPSLFNWASQFPFEWLLSGSFHLYLNVDRTFCKQTVETLIRRRIVRRLVWISTVCISPTKRTLGLNLLMFECSSASIFCEGELQRFSRACACVQICLSLGCTIVICMHDRMQASDMMASSWWISRAGSRYLTNKPWNIPNGCNWRIVRILTVKTKPTHTNPT